MTGPTKALASEHAGHKNLRVLLVNTRDGLGADVAVHVLLARHLGAAGAKVTLTINSQATGAQQMKEALAGATDVDLVYLPLGRPTSDRHGRARLAALLADGAALWGLLKLWALVWDRQIDVLHATDRPRDALVCTLLARTTGRPSIIHLHNTYGPWMGWMCRLAFRSCSLIVGVSEFTSRSLGHMRLQRDRIATVLNAVDSEHFDSSQTIHGQVRQRWDIPTHAPLIAIIGRLIPPKGHDDLLEALTDDKRLAETHLLIVGDDGGSARSYAEHLRARATALGLSERVHFTGLQDVRPIYADVDALVVPTWEEPFGLVVTEAMAMGVPVVAYRAGGIPEIIRSGVDGILVSPRDTKQLAEALATLLYDPGLRARLSSAGRRRVTEQFSPARQASEMAALYRQVCHRIRRTQECSVA